MEIVRRPTRLSELPVHPQLVRYLAQAGEFFAVVAEGTEYEREGSQVGHFWPTIRQ